VVTEVEKLAAFVVGARYQANLFVDRSQIVQLECLRSGIWGTKNIWGRVATYKAG
jgi:phosphosulfolactate synthase (CoM biosynthesis protein A)